MEENLRLAPPDCSLGCSLCSCVRCRWVEQEWAQSPDALWSGGVADYLRHASNILVSTCSLLPLPYLTALELVHGGAHSAGDVLITVGNNNIPSS